MVSDEFAVFCPMNHQFYPMFSFRTNGDDSPIWRYTPLFFYDLWRLNKKKAIFVSSLISCIYGGQTDNRTSIVRAI